MHTAIPGTEEKKAFGDDSIYIGRFLEKPRHIEFQIAADVHGNVIHLGERECSVQRRYQKLIEEAPSPAITPEQRMKIGAKIVRHGRYVTFQMAEVAVPRELFQKILRLIDDLRRRPVPA